jgi:glycosyltransferase involved in cell wall biosynthesis
MNNQITIIIPCKNEGEGIIDILKLIQHLDCQIIIADSSDDDYTFSLLQNYQQIHPLIQIINGGLPAIARNNGARYVTTPYILFLDADIYVKNPKLIYRCVQTAIKYKYDLITCKFKSLDGNYNWVWKIFNIIQWISSKTKPFAIGGFMLFKTETFNQLGGFNEKDKIAEDYHLSSKINPKKFKIMDDYVYTPSRRFEKKGIWYMIKLAWMSWLNRNNDDFFKNDYNYWK